MVKPQKGIKMLIFITKDPFHFGKTLNAGIENMQINGCRKPKQTQRSTERAPLEARIQHFFETLRDAEEGNYAVEPENEVQLCDICDYFEQIFDDVVYDGTPSEQKQ